MKIEVIFYGKAVEKFNGKEEGLVGAILTSGKIKKRERKKK